MPKIDRDGVKIHYEVHGNGPPLILTHGYSSTSAMWEGQIAALSKHHKLVLWDMRGHGQSDYPDDPAAYSEAPTVGRHGGPARRGRRRARRSSAACRSAATCRWPSIAPIPSASGRC